jgi:predicted nucleic acid-binding protein
VDTASVHARAGLGRLVAVELRKMVNTRAGFWLQIAMVAITVVVVAVRSVVGDAADHTFAAVLDVGLQPAAVLLPVVGILLVTSKWSQRTRMITFALVPVRSRVLGAKLLASIVLGVPHCPIRERELTRALWVYEKLSARGGEHQRSVKHADLLIAAAAEAAGMPVLHYDEDYDRIAGITGRPTHWLAPAGSLR